MKTCDIANMMGSWDESLGILIRHLERDEPKIALQRAKEMQRFLRKEMGYLDENDMEKTERELIEIL